MCNQQEHSPSFLTKWTKHVLHVQLKLFLVFSDFNDLFELSECDLLPLLHQILTHYSAKNLLFQRFWNIHWMRVCSHLVYLHLIDCFNVSLMVVCQTINLKNYEWDEVLFNVVWLFIRSLFWPILRINLFFSFKDLSLFDLLTKCYKLLNCMNKWHLSRFSNPLLFNKRLFELFQHYNQITTTYVVELSFNLKIWPSDHLNKRSNHFYFLGIFVKQNATWYFFKFAYH